MTNLTDKEFAVLEAIDASEYGDGMLDPVWTWSIADNIDSDVVPNATSIGGIVASLSKKGFAYADNDPGEDAATGMTEEGAEAYMARKGRLNVNKWLDMDHLKEMEPVWKAAREAREEAARKAGTLK